MKKLYAGKLLQPLMAAGVFLLLSVMYFLPQLQGKVIQQSDIVSVRAMYQESYSWQQKTGKVVLWTNAMFGGMPTYQISAPQQNNLVKYVTKVHQAFIERPIGYFFAAMLGCYIVLLCLGAGHWPAMLGAVGFGLTTNQMSLFEAGHTSKFMTIVYSAYVIGGTLLVYQKRLITGGILFALGMALSLYHNHVQMSYYLAIFLAVYVIIALVHALQQRELPGFAAASAILLAGVAVAAGASASKLWTTLEYTHDTMRGKPVLEKPLATAGASSSQVDGLDWDYAMQWSNGSKDILAMFIPRAAGGSGSEHLSANSEVVKDLRAKGVNPTFGMPLYHGSLPFTAGPAYVGASVFFLFIFGLFYIRSAIRWWLLAAVALSILMSLGKHFPMLNRPMFDLLPMMSKFRAPSSILGITALLIPLGAALGLGGFMKGHARAFQRPIWIALGIVGGITLLIALLGGSMMSFGAPGDARLAETGWNIDALISDRKTALTADAWRSFIWVLLSAAVIWVYHQGKIKQWLLLSALGLILIADLWAVGRRYISTEDFITKRQADAVYDPRPADRQILSDPDRYYRVHDITTNPFNSSMASYHHRTVGGYSPVKMQRYQDVIDRYLAQGNMNVLNMLNTKYFITADDQGQAVARPNPGAMGNAWFVENVNIVRSNNEELDRLDTADLLMNAFVHEQFEDQVKGFDPVKNGTITLTSYAPDELVYKSSAPSDQLAVFSDIYYGPDKGWQAYIDGVKAPHFRANYILRAMNIPAGDHEIRFNFEPRSYRMGEMISLVFSLGIVLALLFGFYRWLSQAEPTPPVAIADPGETSAAKKVRPRKRS
jgi:hypothetical protein